MSNKKKTIHFRNSKESEKALEYAANQCGIVKSEYIRHAVMEANEYYSKLLTDFNNIVSKFAKKFGVPDELQVVLTPVELDNSGDSSNIGFCATEKMICEIKELAKKMGISEGAYIRLAIERKIKKNKKQEG